MPLKVNTKNVCMKMSTLVGISFFLAHGHVPSMDSLSLGTYFHPSLVFLDDFRTLCHVFWFLLNCTETIPVQSKIGFCFGVWIYCEQFTPAQFSLNCRLSMSCLTLDIQFGYCLFLYLICLLVFLCRYFLKIWRRINFFFQR